MIAESKTERCLVLADERGEIRLIIFLELVLMRNVWAVAVHFPPFREGAQRNPGVVLHDDATALHEQIAHTGESLTPHADGRGLEPPQPGPARAAPPPPPALPPLHRPPAIPPSPPPPPPT